MWNISGLAPESSNFARLAAALGIATAVATAVAACGPSGGGGTLGTYAVQFTLSDTTDDLTALTFAVAYTGGNFVGDGTSVSCTLIDNAGDSAVFTDSNSGNLTVAITATTDELVEDQDLVECDFQASSQPTADNFTITISSFAPGDAEDVAVVTSIAVAAAASLEEVTE